MPVCKAEGTVCHLFWQPADVGVMTAPCSNPFPGTAPEHKDDFVAHKVKRTQLESKAENCTDPAQLLPTYVNHVLRTRVKVMQKIF